MTTRFIEPFNLRELFITYFIGDINMFFYVFLLILSYGCAYYGMSNRNYFTILVISCILISAYVETAVLFFTLFVFGTITFKIFARLLQ